MISTCHPERRHKAHGLCLPCYMRAHDRARPPRLYNRDYHREYRRSHLSERQAADRAYRVAHREQKLAQMRAYYAAHREASNAQSRTWRTSNAAARKGYLRAWHAANPDARATYSSQRRARRRGAPGTHTTQEWREKVALFAGCCIYCGEAKPLVRDHNVPLIRGGTNDITNILPSCRSCNLRKHTKTAAEFLALAA